MHRTDTIESMSYLTASTSLLAGCALQRRIAGGALTDSPVLSRRGKWKFFLLATLLLLSFLPSYAQYNNVIIFDCTRSMIYPDGNFLGKPNPKVYWDPSKNALKDLFDSWEEDDIVTILAFQESVIGSLSGKRSQLQWDDINNLLENALKQGRNTCILSAWNSAEKYLDSPLPTFFYIFTDGKEDHGANGGKRDEHEKELCHRIESFCSRHHNARGIYVEVSNEAIVPDIQNAIHKSPCFGEVSPADLKKPFALFSQGKVRVNLADMDGGASAISSPLEFSRKGKYSLDIEDNDDIFSVTTTGIENGKAVFSVSLKRGLSPEKAKEQLGGGASHSFAVKISSDDCHLLDCTLIIEVDLRVKTTLGLLEGVRFRNNRYQFDKTWRYDKFLFCPARSKILEVNLEPSFNHEAMHKGAEVEFSVDPLKECDLFYNGTPCPDGRFLLSTEDDAAVLGIRFHDGAKEGKHIYSLRVQRVRGIDEIRAVKSQPCHPRDFSVPFQIRLKVKCNPLKSGVIWLIILLAIIYLVRCIVVCRKKIRGMHVNTQNGGEEVKPCVKCVLTSRRATGKKGGFCGPTYYVNILMCTAGEVMIKKKGDGSLYFEGNTDGNASFTVNGQLLLGEIPIQPGTTYTFQNNNQNFTIYIIYN